MSSLYFTAEDWARIERDTLAWWAGELDRPLVYLAVTDPGLGATAYEFQSNYPMSMPADAAVDCYAPILAATHYLGDAFPWL